MSQPSVCSAMNSVSMSPFSTSRCSSPLSSARSVPGLICRNRSAFSAVVVRRGSTTISLAPAFSRSAIRRYRIGWQSAMFEPMTKNRSRAIEVGVRARRAVGAERLLVPGSGAGHAQPRVRLDVHGPTETLGQFGGQILCLDGHLARHIERDGVRPVLVDDGAQPSARLGNGVVDGRRHQFLVARRPQQRRRQPAVVGGHHLGVRGALGAQPPEIGGMQLVTGDTGDDGPARCRRRSWSAPRCRSRRRSTSTPYGSPP